MYWTMLRRELLGRKKQTIIVAAGLAVAVALVMVVSALTAGVQQAQAKSLESVYGVGTDLTVTAAPTGPGEDGGMGGPGGGPRFDFAEGEGSTTDGVTSFAQSQLSVQMGSTAFEADVLETIVKLDGVQSVTGSLALSSTSFTGEMPDMSQMSQSDGERPEGGMGGGPGGQGGSSFGIDSFTVLGVDPAATAGPLTATAVSDGRALTADDEAATALVALIDETYATGQELVVGDTVDLGGTEVEIVGVVAATGSDATTAADVFIPLSTAQSLADLAGQLTTVSVTATSVDDIPALQEAIAAALPEMTVNSQEDLAATLSSSLSTTTSLITNLGTWLSIAVLCVAVALAILLTSSGVSRRTREFGTLKAIGWSNRRVMSQIAGESAVQALLGGVAGVLLGVIAVTAITVWSPTIGGSAAQPSAPGEGFGGAEGAGTGMPGGGMTPPGGGFGGGSAISEITLSAPVNVWIVMAALGLSLLGGLLAAAFGAWRVSRLSPAEALRSVA